MPEGDCQGDSEVPHFANGSISASRHDEASGWHLKPVFPEYLALPAWAIFEAMRESNGSEYLEELWPLQKWQYSSLFFLNVLSFQAYGRDLEWSFL